MQNHVQNTLRKLQMHNRVELTRWAIEQGLDDVHDRGRDRASGRPRRATPRRSMALERDTNLVALAHVFPGVPYPEDDVRERWLRLLADPAVRVEVVGPPDRLDVYLAYDELRLRHLGVRPERWGEGLARAGARPGRLAPGGSGCSPTTTGPRLLRAPRLAPTGREQKAEWPPYPVELEYAR